MSQVKYSVIASGAIITFSIFFTALTWPGVLSSDSVASWIEATTNQYETIKPPLVAEIQRLFFLASNKNLQFAIGTFSFVQSLLFWASIACVFSVLIPNGKRRTITFLAFFTVLPILPYSTVHWTDSWCVIFSLFFLTLTLSSPAKFSPFKLLLSILMLGLLLATRHNTISILPIGIFLVYRQIQASKLFVPVRSKWIHPSSALLTFAAIGLAFALSVLPNYNAHVTRSPSLLQFALLNQYIGTIENTEGSQRDNLIEERTKQFETAYGNNSLRRSLNAYSSCFNPSLVWGPDAIIGFQKILANKNFPGWHLIGLIQDSPKGFLLHKLKYWRGQLHDSSTLFPFQLETTKKSEIYLNIEANSISESSRVWIFRKIYAWRSSLLYRHWAVFMLAFFSTTGICFVQKRLDKSISILAFGMFYAIPYLIFETGCEWRYLLPTYVPSMICIFCFISLQFTSSFSKLSKFTPWKSNES